MSPEIEENALNPVSAEVPTDGTTFQSEVEVNTTPEDAPDAPQAADESISEEMGYFMQGTEAEEEVAEEAELPDYTQYSKAELLHAIKELSQQKEIDYRRLPATLKEMKSAFDEIANAERKEAYDKFIADGGEKDGFEFHAPADTKQFYQLHSQLFKQRNKYYAQLEEERERNLAKKNEILEQLRALIDAEESQSSIDNLKRLQQEWRKIGAVPSALTRTLWASYSALIDRFYNNHSIYLELKELDRKKNLAQKLELCQRAERLSDASSMTKAIRELNELHEEFKHIGPVPREEQEQVWQRFKAASDKIYEKKREQSRQQDEERKANLARKMEIAAQLLPYAEFRTESIAEWNHKTKEVLEIQKQWEAIRFIPRESIKEAGKAFWSPFKAFFANKNSFIRTLDEEREQNLAKKNEIIAQAEAVVKSDADPRKIADELKKLQQQWKEIGPVPGKLRDKVYDRFKEVCDSFFNKRRDDYNSQEKEYEENLAKKRAIIKQIDESAPTLADAEDTMRQFVADFRAIGFVPRKNKQSVQQQFEKAIANYLNRTTDADAEQKEQLQLALELELFKDSPEARNRLQGKEAVIRRKIAKLENDIDTLRNNMGFLANSREAEKLKGFIQKQIDELAGQVNAMKRQLKMFQLGGDK